MSVVTVVCCICHDSVPRTEAEPEGVFWVCNKCKFKKNEKEQ